jgi:D-alanyl-D-alanine carboxypeptidase
MMGRFLAVAAAGAVLFLAGGAATAPSPSATLAEVDRIARAWVSDGHTPGMTLAVMQDGKVVFSKGYGQAQLENNVPVQPETVFRIGSVSKQFTAAAILKLAEEGRLSLDDKLSKYYPAFPRGGEVTIRQMLNHTSGLHNYLEVGSDPRAGLTFMADYTTEAWAQHIAEQQPLYDFAPGTAYHYSNSGYFLSAGIVEKASGQSLGDYLRDHIFKPAGMVDTAVDAEGPIVPLRASGYEVAQKGVKGYRTANYLSVTVAGGAGALRSTVGDLIKWQDALLSGRVISPAFLKEMLTPGRLNDGRLASGAPYPAPKSATPASAQQDYGMGVNVGAVAGHRRVSHGGNIYGFNSSLDSYPDDGIAWVALTNAGTGVSGLNSKIEAALLGLPVGGEEGRPK